MPLEPTSEETASLAEQPWPAEGLEAVPRCPACGGAERQPLYDGLSDRVYRCAPGRWSLARCASPACSAAWLDPRPTPDTLPLAYARYFTHTPPAIAEEEPVSGAQALVRAARNDYLRRRYNVRGARFEPALPLGALLMRLWPHRRARADRLVRGLRLPRGNGGPHETRPRLLDVGSGNGAFLLWMRELGWDVQGLEPDREAAAQANAAGIPTVCAPVERMPWSDGEFAALCVNHVVEHLYDPLDALRRCRRALAPGGEMVLITPNLYSLGHRAYGRDWLHLDAPRHLALFTPRALARLCEQAGFRMAGRFGFPDARITFYSSIALAHDTWPGDYAGPVPPDFDRMVQSAECRAARDPECAEEIALLLR